MELRFRGAAMVTPVHLPEGPRQQAAGNSAARDPTGISKNPLPRFIHNKTNHLREHPPPPSVMFKMGQAFLPSPTN